MEGINLYLLLPCLPPFIAFRSSRSFLGLACAGSNAHPVVYGSLDGGAEEAEGGVKLEEEVACDDGGGKHFGGLCHESCF